MAKKGVRSIRGEVVDFDLLKVKQQIEDRKKPDSVELREKYIDIRRRRNPRRNVSDLVNEQRQNEQDARDRIRKSKEAKELAIKNLENFDGEDDVTVVREEPVSAVMPSEPKRSTRKVVKRSKTED
jgi:hypothetical protein